MSCSCFCSEDNCRAVAVVRVVPVLLGLAIVYGVVRVVGGMWQIVAPPPTSALPLLFVAVAGAVWGLWLGFKIHGRGEPLAVGLFGIAVTLLGALIYAPLILIGGTILLVAGVWSARFCASGRMGS